MRKTVLRTKKLARQHGEETNANSFGGWKTHYIFLTGATLFTLCRASKYACNVATYCNSHFIQPGSAQHLDKAAVPPKRVN